MERPGKPINVPLLLWRAGDVFLPEKYRIILDTPFTNVYGADVNGWSVVHFFTGMILGKTMTQTNASIAHILWEFFQIIIGMSNKKEDLIDIALDTLFFELGLRYFK